MSKTFQEFIETIKLTNIKPSYYYTDYQVVARHIEKFKDVLNAFPETINTRKEFIKVARDIYNNDNELISIIPLFTGIRPDRPIVLDDDYSVEKFTSKTVSFKKAMDFLEEVGFMDRISENAPLNLKSYFFGVNVGLDSNGRKNRGGKQMEKLVGTYIKPLITNQNFIEQATFKKINEKFGTNYINSSKKR